jgi:hypothetical protein
VDHPAARSIRWCDVEQRRTVSVTWHPSPIHSKHE